MEKPIKILHLEDDPVDVELIQAKLEEADFRCQITCVQTREEFESILRNEGPDVILADYRLPMYDGMSALRLARELYADIPFIFVSGVMGEEAAIKALTQGATDYVLKNNLSRLASAVKRALKEAVNRRERDRAEQALQKSEILMHGILDLVDEGFIVIDRQYRLLSANEAFCSMVNQPEDRILGRTCYEVSHHIKRPCFELGEKCPVQHTLDTGTSCFVTHIHKDESGIPHQVELKSYPILDSSGALTSVIVSLNDVTERNRLHDQLRQAQKMEAIGTLAGGIAHDFNNILSSVIGYTEIALDHELPQDAPARNSLEHVLKAALRAKDLVKQILTFSQRTQSDKYPINPTPIIEEALKLIRASLPTSIEIRQNYALDDKKILADPTQIHQVFMNLCTNAAHAMRENGGVLDIGLSIVEFNPIDSGRPEDIDPGTYIMLAVADTGHGMPLSVLEQIFDPFFTTKNKEEGTGLGLAVVHGIVKEHNGAIEVESKPGKGTTFKLYFPLLRHSQKAIDAGEKPLPLGHEHILVVDDEKEIAFITQRNLEQLGYSVTTVSGSLDALSLFTEDPTGFDLVITDQTMPEMTGDQLSLEMMALRPDTPIILTTGFSHKINAAQAKSIGIRELLQKPVTWRDLAETVRRVIDQNREQNGKNTGR